MEGETWVPPQEEAKAGSTWRKVQGSAGLEGRSEWGTALPSGDPFNRGDKLHIGDSSDGKYWDRRWWCWGVLMGSPAGPTSREAAGRIF